MLISMSKNQQEVEKINLPELTERKVSNKDSTLGLKSIPKKPRFKRSGHLTDQILKYKDPQENSQQLSIFDTLMPETKEKIRDAKVEQSHLVEGIRLSPAEHKLIDCVNKILHDKSQHIDEKEKNYYTGNLEPEIVNYGNIEALAPRLSFTLYQLTKEYKGGQQITGKDVENVKELLRALAFKKFLITYKRVIHNPEGGRKEQKIETYASLLQIIYLEETHIDKNENITDQKKETIVLLNPIFKDQIDSKYISYPTDINRRTIIAYGSHNLSESAIRLRDYLLRELSSKRYTPEIGLDKLPFVLGFDKWIKEGRKAKIKAYTEKAIECVINLELVEKVDYQTDSKGGKKIIFSLNKEWE